MNDNYDFIVVGAGSAGCVVASRLSENPRNRVLLLENGPDSEGRGSAVTPEEKQWLQKPEFFQFMQTSRLDRQYWGEPEPGLNGRSMFMPRGQLLGGTSTFIAGLAVRGNASDYDGWETAGNSFWAFSDVLPFFKRLERNRRRGIDSRLHGTSGPLPVNDLKGIAPATAAFLEACQRLGYQHNPDFNGEVQEGFGLYQLYLDDRGIRVNAANGYLNPRVRSRPNLDIRTDALAVQVVLEPVRGKLTATGVAYTDRLKVNRPQKEAHASREVIVSCGTVDTPKLLMLSGLGPAAILQSQGIHVYRDVPGIGKNLQDHLVAPVGFLYSDQTRPHPFLASGIHGGMFLRVYAHSQRPDLQFVFNHALLGSRGPILPDGYQLVPVLLHPQSRGEISLRSPAPYGTPVIRFGYLRDSRDLATLRTGVRRALHILASKSFDELRGQKHPYAPPPDPDASDDELDQFIRGGSTSLFHPVGTCKMGPPSDAGAVVDAELRVRGIKRLRVADASILPELPSGNVHTPTVMIGERAASFLLRDCEGRSNVA